MVSNCPRCKIVLGVKLSSFVLMVSNCPQCQIVRGVKLSSLPSDYTTQSFVVFVFWFRFHWKFEQYCCCAAPHPSPPPACSPRDITRQAAVAPSLEGETTTIKPWLRIFWDNHNPTLVENISREYFETTSIQPWLIISSFKPLNIWRISGSKQDIERGNWERQLRGQVAASAKEGQGELVGIKNRPRLVKDGSDV